MPCYIFDVDDTLIKYHNFSFEEWYDFIAAPVAEELNIPLNLQIWREMIEGKISRRYPEKYGVPAEKFWAKVDKKNLEYRKFMFREGRLSVYKDTKVLERLKGKKIAWSASSTNCMRYVLSLFNLIKYFDLIIGKDYENYRYLEYVKPAPKFIEIIKEKMQCKKCVLIGDDEKDMIAAKGAGCVAILIKRRLSSSELADFTIDTLWDLQEMDKKFL